LKNRRTRSFREDFDRLPKSVQRKARDSFRRFQENPNHRGLAFKQIFADESIFSVRIGIHYRALARRRGDVLNWFWIGSHAEYDQLLQGH
jgi:hypothetical protein